MTEQKIESFASWAIVEIMGHKKLAGHVSERVIAGQAFVQVDVPEYAMRDGVKVLAFTQLFGPSSIYCITPCTEETARRAADSFRARPVEYLDLTRPALPAPFGSSADDDTIGATTTRRETDAATIDDTLYEKVMTVLDLCHRCTGIPADAITRCAMCRKLQELL